MLKVVISGFYGFENIGDEAILQATVEEFRREYNDIDIIVLSADPEKTKKLHNVKAVNRSNFFDIYKAIRTSDALVSGGGSLLQDVTSVFSIWYYMGIMLLAFMLRKPVYAFAQGIGPIQNGFNRMMFKYVINRVKTISVRDEKSKNELNNLGVRRYVECTADPALMLNPVSPERGMEILVSESSPDKLKKPKVGFFIRKWKNNPLAIDIFAQVADKIADEMGAEIVFIPFYHKKDLKTAEEIAKKMKKQPILISGIYSPSEILSVVGLMDVNLCVRLHGLVFSTKMGVPAVAVSYDPKIDSFMHIIGMETACNYSDMNSEKLFNAVALAWEERQKIGSAVKKIAEKLEERSRTGVKQMLADIKSTERNK